jgi:hypothetical protein
VRRLLPLLVGGLLLAGAIATTLWSVPHAATARSLYLFEQEAPTQLARGWVSPGGGLLGLDLVTFDGDRQVTVYRQGEPKAAWPRPEFAVGEHGARYADEAPSSGAWRPFALRAGVAWMLMLLALAIAARWIVREVPGAFRHLAFVVFGQRDPEVRPVSWVAGGGTHGSGGGQVPPLVPYNPDWDLDRRIR